MKVTKEDLDKVAVLSRLSIPEEESGKYIGQLDKFLAYVENLKAVSEYIAFNPQPFKDICRIEKDTPIESVVVDLVLALVNIVDFVDKLNIK